MASKKPTAAASSVNQSKPVDKKREAPLLIWYNKTTDDKSEEDKFLYYTNSVECLKTIEESSKPIFLILTSSSPTDLLSRIHSLKQIDTIFIYCKSLEEKQRSEYLLQHYSKIFDLFINKKQLIDVIDENVNLHKNQSGNDYLRLAESLKQKTDLNRALKYTHKALEMYRNQLTNPNHPLIARCLNNLGGIYDAQGDVNRSYEYYEQAIKIYAQLTPSLSKQPLSNILKK